MAVGKIGSKRGAGAARGAGSIRKAGGSLFQAKVERVAPTSSLRELGAVVGREGDPIVAQAAEIARQFRDGAIKTKEEATRQLVANILREIVRTKSKTLREKIAEDIEGDPRLRETIERIWSKAEP
ncbi:MAG: hypothetical protein FWC28_03920 [Proteobacteria bacterium]|nr:hypothetical protein [Cystobacterineae bacterium]MCL2258765.1 hypothetical protein [Cystobacterineae bacterium]MCL2314384.1 hypothetical protein [Pseudomonadota bacterium]